MKLICEGVDLSDGLLKTVKACATKTTNPLLECIKIAAQNDTVTLLATDGEIAIRKDLRAEVIEEGAVCVPGKFFADFVKRLENEQVTLASEGDRLTINYGDAESALQVLPADDFPAIDTDIAEQHVELSAKDFKELVAGTTFCCAQDDSRPVLKGVLVEASEGEVRFTALDGYRLAICRRPAAGLSGDIRIICPGRTLNEIARMLGGDDESVCLYVQKNMLLVRIDDTVLTSRLFEGEFVNVAGIVPHAFATEMKVDRALLDESVERAAVLARIDKNSVITFDVHENGMGVSSNTSIGRVDEAVPVSMTGKDVRIALNCKFVSDCLKAAGDDAVRFSFNGPVAPCLVTPLQGERYLYLILPVRTTG